MYLSLSPHNVGNLAESEVHFQLLFGSKIYKLFVLPPSYAPFLFNKSLM